MRACDGCTTFKWCRYLSAVKDERLKAAELYEGLGLKQPTAETHPEVKKEELIEAVRNALYASKICSYAQVRTSVTVALVAF
jgi:6-phosphogluconate dehydrogenase